MDSGRDLHSSYLSLEWEENAYLYLTLFISLLVGANVF